MTATATARKEGSTVTHLARAKSTTVARPLKVLIPLIQADLEHGDRAGMEYYADAGDKLIEAKTSGQITPSYWPTWLSKNFTLSKTTANRYMRLARLRAEQQLNHGVVQLPRSITDMEGETVRKRERRGRDRTYQSVLRELETDLYAQEQQTRDDEIKLHRDMALELIDVGFKALATRLHPDRGGSQEAMTRLNRVHVELKGVAKTRKFV